jgi:hypothetical protein
MPEVEQRMEQLPGAVAERAPRPRARPRAVRLAWFILVCLSSAAVRAQAQQNLSFEVLDADGTPLGWRSADNDATIASDGTAAAEGERSLKVTRSTGNGVTRLAQRTPAALLLPGADARGRRLRLRGFVRATAAAPALWLRIDGPAGPLFLDSYGYGRETSDDLAPTLEAGGDGDWRAVELQLPLPPDVDEVAFGIAVRGQGTAWFDGLALTAIATDSLPPAAPVAVRYLDAALALMREHSLRRNDVDWPRLRVEALEHARGAATAADAHSAVRFALRELGDRHSYLQSARVSRELATAAVSNARTGSPPMAPDGRRMGEHFAYLRVPGFAGGTPAQQVEFAETLINVIQELDATAVCGWVVDLRQNSCGNLWPMLAGLGPLLGDAELAASVYPDGRRVAVWHREGQAGFGDFTQLRVRAPYRLRRATAVAVLLGPGTASSAEVLAVAFRGRGPARSFGAPTRGLSAGNRIFALADGASLVLTVAATSDAAGRVVSGPLIPDQLAGRAAAGSGASSGEDAALDAAAAWLAAGDSCR